MKKYLVKVKVEGYVWLEADNPQQAMFAAADITGMKAGNMLGACLNDVEVAGVEVEELNELSPIVAGAVTTSVDL